MLSLGCFFLCLFNLYITLCLLDTVLELPNLFSEVLDSPLAGSGLIL